MKRLLPLLILLILSVIIISACNVQQQKRTICGDGICDSTESCACSDCASSDFCQIKNVTKNCDDSNECTIDSFNPSTNSCVYETKANCCGNGKCELDESSCDFSTYQTKCAKDCSLSCPAKLIVHQNKDVKTQDQFSFSCADLNCEKTSNNQFRVTKYSAVQTFITNIGERSTDIITSSFTCEKDSIKIAQNDNDNYKGIIIKDFFNENEDKVDSISSRINQKNQATYKLSFNITQQISPTELKCTTVLTSSSDLQNIQVVTVTVY